MNAAGRPNKELRGPKNIVVTRYMCTAFATNGCYGPQRCRIYIARRFHRGLTKRSSAWMVAWGMIQTEFGDWATGTARVAHKGPARRLQTSSSASIRDERVKRENRPGIYILEFVISETSGAWIAQYKP